VPHDASPSVAFDRFDGAVDGLADRPVLVILGDQLRHVFALAVRGYKVAYQVKYCPWHEGK
jgi:hypothetical protein